MCVCVCVSTTELFNHWSTCISISHEGLKWTGYGSHGDSDHFLGYRRINNVFIVSEKSNLDPHSTFYWLHSCVFSCKKTETIFHREFIERVSLRIHGRAGGPAWQTTETRPSRAQPGSPRNMLLRTPCSPHHTLAPSCCCESSWLPALWTSPSTSKTQMEPSSQHTQAAGPCPAARSRKTNYLTSWVHSSCFGASGSTVLGCRKCPVYVRSLLPNPFQLPHNWRMKLGLPDSRKQLGHHRPASEKHKPADTEPPRLHTSPLFSRVAVCFLTATRRKHFRESLNF